MTALRRLMPGDLLRLRRFWSEHWGGEEMIVHGEQIHPEGLQGFVTETWDGVVTYRLCGEDCEIVSLDSLQEGRGTGSALVQAVVREARDRGCRRVTLTTTNSNLRALGFYQRRGFMLAELRPGAVNESRRRKPGIPLTDRNGIPLRDEIDLEMKL